MKNVGRLVGERDARWDDIRFIIGGRRAEYKAPATCPYVCTDLYVEQAYVLGTQCAT